MYPGTFEYERAESVEHAVELLQEFADEETELLAGGHSLVPLLKTGLADVDRVIDIGNLDDLRGITTGEDATRIGSLTPYVDIVDHEEVWETGTVVAEAAGEIGDIQVRSVGTIGGNIAHSDPASDLPAAVLAADARLHVQGPDGERSIDAGDFFQGMYTTALESDELITHIEVPNLASADAGAYVKKPSPSSGYALIGVAVVLQTDGGTIESARVAANGVMDHALRLTSVEDTLEGGSLSESTLEAAADAAGSDLDVDMMMDDDQASSEYRQGLLPAYTERALTTAHDRIA